MTKALNQGQQAAADGFMEFLLGDGIECIISGPGGVGKTFLMGHLIDSIIPAYQNMCEILGIQQKYGAVYMTATTNKAAEVLSLATQRPAETVHSFMNLVLKDDFKTGKSNLTRSRAWHIHEGLILFIDECSMIDRNLLKEIRDSTHNCKIVYVGDDKQMSPVGEDRSPIYNQRLPFFELTEPMRNNGQPALQAICAQMRHSVDTLEFKPIQLVPGVIDQATDADIEQMLLASFHDQDHQNRFLSFTNRKVVDYNNYIRWMRQLPQAITAGEHLINNSAVRIREFMLSVERGVEILKIEDTPVPVEIEDGVNLYVRHADIRTDLGEEITQIPIPSDYEHYHQLIKFYGRTKNWTKYFLLKNNYPDLRPRDASTVYKAQGSSLDVVYIDLSDIGSCNIASQVARMLYVAVSRARTRIVLYGQLPDKYGGPAIL